MKKKILSAFALLMLSFSIAAPLHSDVWKKKIVQHSKKEYDVHLSIEGKVQNSDDAYEKELLLFISNKAVKDGYEYFTFTVDATNKDTVVVHVQNFDKAPSRSNNQDLAVKYFAAKEVIEMN